MSAAYSHRPLSFSCSMQRTRFFTLASFTQAAAPADAFTAAGVSVAVRRSGMITPWAPMHSQERRMAPRLWGSVMESNSTTKGGSFLSAARAKMSSTWA